MSHNCMLQVGGVLVIILCHANEETRYREFHMKGLGMNNFNDCMRNLMLSIFLERRIYLSMPMGMVDEDMLGFF